MEVLEAMGFTTEHIEAARSRVGTEASVETVLESLLNPSLIQVNESLPLPPAPTIEPRGVEGDVTELGISQYDYGGTSACTSIAIYGVRALMQNTPVTAEALMTAITDGITSHANTLAAVGGIDIEHRNVDEIWPDLSTSMADIVKHGPSAQAVLAVDGSSFRELLARAASVASEGKGNSDAAANLHDGVPVGVVLTKPPMTVAFARVRILSYYCSSFLFFLSLSRSITVCLHSLRPHGTSLTIILSPINQPIINRHNTHIAITTIQVPGSTATAPSSSSSSSYVLFDSHARPEHGLPSAYMAAGLSEDALVRTLLCLFPRISGREEELELAVELTYHSFEAHFFILAAAAAAAAE
jgi:hypothetical protein